MTNDEDGDGGGIEPADILEAISKLPAVADRAGDGGVLAAVEKLAADHRDARAEVALYERTLRQARDEAAHLRVDLRVVTRLGEEALVALQRERARAAPATMEPPKR